MKKKFFYNHPIIGGLIAMLIIYLACNFCGLIGASVMMSAMGDHSERVNTIANTCVMIAALISIPVYWFFNRKNGYHAPIKIHGTNLKSVWCCIGIFALVSFAGTMFGLTTLEGGFPQIPVPTLATILLATYAGVNEEIIDRCIPMSIMMRNKPNSRRIWLAVILTSLVFSVTHIINLFSGQDLTDTVVQIVFALGMGLFFAAIYIRTGSIVPSIVLHALQDLLSFVVNPILEEATLSPVFQTIIFLGKIVPIILAIVMLLPKYHKSIIDTWTRIWSEKNTSVVEAA